MPQDHLEEFNLSKKIKAKLKNKNLLKKQLAMGKSAQEVLELSDGAMNKFYHAACELLDHMRYADAANAFLFLITLNPYKHNYWLGLGMSYQLCEDYEMACDAYEMAAACKIDDPVPYFYLAKSLLSMRDRKSALLAYDLAIKYADCIEEHDQLKKEAKKAKKILLKSERDD